MKKIALTLFILLSCLLISAQHTIRDTIQLSDVSVKGTYTAPKVAPFSFTNMEKADITLKSQNSEPAILFSTSPSVSFYSDNGTGFGYIYYRLRGIDQTRINVTLNGVPMNEPEDQGVYFNNYPDFLNSVSDVQIIRGAGLTKSGVSSYGGSISFDSYQFADKFSGEVSTVYGSYNTFQLSAGVNSKNFFIKASSIQTDGYKYNSGNKSQSAFYGLKLGNWKFYGFVGNARNQMAWMGESLDSIRKNPRFNTQNSAETDHFYQIHNQAHYNKGNFSFILYDTYLDGWYDTDNAHYRASGIGRLNVLSNWLGSTMNYNFHGDHTNFNLGVNGYEYFRTHYGYTDLIRDYKNTGYICETSPYAKGELIFGDNKKFILFGDIQYRYNLFIYHGDQTMLPKTYNFWNWSGGATLRVTDKSVVYYGIGKTHREPTRTDLFNGNDNFILADENYVKPEVVFDHEIGYKYLDEWCTFKGNFYYMDFKDEIVLNGKMGPNSILLHQNVDNSYRSGIELDFRYRWFNGFEVKTNENFSINQIRDQNVIFQPILTPNVIINVDGIYNYKKLGYVGLNIRYNGSSYIDLANTKEYKLPNFTLFSAYAGIHLKGIDLRVNANNLFNSLILSNGIIGFDGTPKYWVMGNRNAMVSLKYTF
jgi:iron complex outermembrane receptor protein